MTWCHVSTTVLLCMMAVVWPHCVRAFDIHRRPPNLCNLSDTMRFLKPSLDVQCPNQITITTNVSGLASTRCHLKNGIRTSLHCTVCSQCNSSCPQSEQT